MQTMGIVQMGKQWVIKTAEDYEKALEVLDDNEFCANMSDDFSCYRREIAEIDKQRYDVKKQAIALGII